MISSCKVIRDLAPLYSDRVADPETAAEIRAHLRGCPECRRYYRRFELTVRPTAAPLPVPEQGYALLSRRVRSRQTGGIVLTALLCAASVGCLVYTAVRRTQNRNEEESK